MEGLCHYSKFTLFGSGEIIAVIRESERLGCQNQ